MQVLTLLILALLVPKRSILQPSTLVLMVVLKLPQVITQWITMV
ncbi:Uncharacterised protein [Vibrio cholerae]|nr:Uncharacterised protein [Vibrio cholerae]